MAETFGIRPAREIYEAWYADEKPKRVFLHRAGGGSRAQDALADFDGFGVGRRSASVAPAPTSRTLAGDCRRKRVQRHAERVRQPSPVLELVHLVEAVDERRYLADDRRAAVGHRQVGALHEGGYHEVEQRRRLGNRRVPPRRVGSDERVWIQTGGQRRDLQRRRLPAVQDALAFAPAALRHDGSKDVPRRFKAAQRRLLSGGVRVERENEIPRERAQLRHLILGERRSHRRHHVRVAVLVGGDGVHVALNDNGAAALPYLGNGEVERVQRVALVEGVGRGGVYVLGNGIVERARAEAGDGAVSVEYGKHEAVSEEVPDRAVLLALPDQAGGYGVFSGDVVRSEIANQRVARIGAEAELERLARALADAAPVEIAPRRRARVGFQRLLIEKRRRAVGAQNGVGLRALVGRAELHARAPRQRSERVSKLHVLRAHHEAENIAARGARAETAPRLPLRADDERRRPLGVERAVGFVSIARLPQRRRVWLHDVENVEFGFDFVYGSHAIRRDLGVGEDFSMFGVRAIGAI